MSGVRESSPRTPLLLPADAEPHQVEVWSGYRDWQGKASKCLWRLTAVVSEGRFTVEAWQFGRRDSRLLRGTLPLVGTRPWFGGHADEALIAAVEKYGEVTDWPTVKLGACWGCNVNAPLAHERQPGECAVCAARQVTCCVDCGQPDPGHYMRSKRERMLTESRCFSCLFWRDVAESPPQVVTDDYHVYSIRTEGKSSAPPSTRGFSGSAFVVDWHDGRPRVFTEDLWSSGIVPPHLRGLFAPNASVTSAYPHRTPEAALAEVPAPERVSP